MKRKRIILAGGSGYLGHLLSSTLPASEYEVIVLSRSPQKTDTFGRSVFWDARTSGEWSKELEGAAAVINLSGRSINTRYTKTNRQAILDSRVLSTRAVGAAIAQCAEPPRAWFNASAVTIYRESPDHFLTENSELAGPDEGRDEFPVEVARAWEGAMDHSPTPQTRKVILRISVVLGPRKGTIFPTLRRLVRWGLGGAAAGGHQYVAWIHEKDLCRSVEWLLAREDLAGPFNLASPNPVTNSEMMKAYRRVLKRPIGLPATKWMLEVGAFIMRTETDLITRSRRMVPEKLLASGFRFDFPEIEGALAEIENRVVCARDNLC